MIGIKLIHNVMTEEFYIRKFMLKNKTVPSEPQIPNNEKRQVEKLFFSNKPIFHISRKRRLIPVY